MFAQRRNVLCDTLSRLAASLADILPFSTPNTKTRCRILDRYIPDTAQMRTKLEKYKSAFTETISENKELKAKNEKLSGTLDQTRHESVFEKMQHFQLKRDLEEACALIERIPPEVIKEYTESTAKGKAVQEHEVS